MEKPTKKIDLELHMIGRHKKEDKSPKWYDKPSTDHLPLSADPYYSHQQKNK